MANHDAAEGLLLDRQLWAEQCKISARAEHGGMVVCGMWMAEKPGAPAAHPFSHGSAHAGGTNHAHQSLC